MPFFDPHEELAGTNYDPIPDGEHTCIVNSSAWKDSASGGNYLEIEFSIFGGQFEGRMIWDRLNLVNPNPTAVSIAQQDLASICRAVGVDKISDTEELHYKEVIVTVTIRKGDNGYEDSNEIKAYAPAGRSAPAAAPAAPAAVATPAAAAPAAPVPGKKPWE